GKIIPVSITASLTRIGKRRILQGIFIDINERKRVQAELFQAQKLASIGQLAAGVAHEINNPLSALSAEIQWLRERTKDAKLAKSLEFMNTISMRIARVINSLLLFFRETPPEYRSNADINSLINETLLLAQRRLKLNRIKVIKRLDDSIEKITVNKSQIEQIFINILQNCMDSMPEGGVVTISTGHNKERGGVDIIFKDTGTGIPKQNLSRIFDPFFTTKPPGRGTGLGLSVSHGIIVEHGGTIKAERRQNKGTRVVVFLPGRIKR
ncbi:MAG: sensor histidine kinase, partial [Planctomycetota bacterium]